MPYDTLLYSGNEKKLSDWGFTLHPGTLTRNNMRPDTFEAQIVTGTVNDNPTFAFEGQVTVFASRTSATGAVNTFSGGVQKFIGKRVVNPVVAPPGAGHLLNHRFENVWYDWENTHYLQLYKGVAGYYTIGEVVLFSSIQNPSKLFYAPITVGDQLQSIFQFLLDQYAGRTLNAGAIDITRHGVGSGGDALGMVYNQALSGSPTIDAAFFNLYLPTYISKPLSCADAIRACLKLSPRTNIAFDYTTTPPTLYVRSIDNFPSVSLPLFTGNLGD